AEDGIRDDLVTGVQTCALPIWPKSVLSVAVLLFAVALAVSFSTFFHRASPPTTRNLSEITTPILGNSIAVLPFQNLSDEKQNARSEERRVGKESERRT